MPAEIARFPHCDQRVLHAPGECEFCDMRPEWQALRKAWGISFTGHPPQAMLPQCSRPMTETQPGYGSPDIRCMQPAGHDGDCHPYPAWDILPCPADFARPPDSPSHHQRWPGNRPEGYRA